MNDDLLECIDSAYKEVITALQMLHDTQAGPTDVDLYGCTMHYAEQTLQRAAVDLRAAGASV